MHTSSQPNAIVDPEVRADQILDSDSASFPAPVLARNDHQQLMTSQT